ncbi:ISL3 family transposase [Mycolicibacterium brumae]|uniref:ISL3 family transposase n=1 Tax=Mycolicibacterium brumae TaxID=85968 RepID=A0A2G5PE61_9MYCO|nr:ISL3 family transposase [Mycolicibacterium brumae]MCV7191739.1 ISL3 family transposase [Mycolicibacterium brumae]PIB76370.1 ISL3 family transposase [Mycolicibacterium brumae]UWW07044.1 ISL3 family transposase [Mycolicibacterium brumae]
MSEPTCLVADTICRTVELGVAITGAAIAEDLTWIDCRPVEADPGCPVCGLPGRLRDHVVRVLTDLPVVGHPTRLRVRLPRFTCDNDGCEMTIFRARIDRVAEAKASVTRRCGRWILQRLAVDKMAVAAIATALRLGWDTVNAIAAESVRELVSGDPGRLDGVRYLGVDEHKWKHRRGQGEADFVTVIVDLTPVIDRTGPARLLDMVAGRSAKAFADWLAATDANFRSRIQVVAMDGFAGYHSATAQALPAARAVMDPFHVVHLAAEKLTRCRQRVQQDTCGHRGRAADPLYRIRRIVLTRTELLTERQKTRLATALGADDAHIAVEVTAACYQELIAAYDNPDRRAGKLSMFKCLKRIRSDLPKGLEELAQLGRSLWKRRAEILAYFDVGVSNGPVEAINGRLEHLRGIALGFRNLDNYTLRSLIHSGQLQNRINAL